MLRPYRSLHIVLATILVASCGAPADLRLEPWRDGAVGAVTPDVTVDGVVPPRATLPDLLREQVSSEMTTGIVQAVAAVFDPRDLRANQPYRITRTLSGLFREFRYEIDGDNFLRVIFHDEPGTTAAAFDAAVVPIPKTYRPDAVSAEISRDTPSVSAAFEAGGEDVQLARQVSEIFTGELDFNADLRIGDRIDVLFDRVVREGDVVGYGNVRAVVLERGGRHLSALRYVDAGGTSHWYDEQGKSLRRVFLRSPLPFDPRVTSGFSSNRFHPVLGVSRPHLGVDYGAPYGTAVNAVADGVVEIADWAGEAGRMVRIRHNGGYETAYLHLSSFGPGIRTGVSVVQGQLVGRVGQTGLATAPHLDYRIIKNGVYVNPVTELRRMPTGDTLPSGARAEFETQRDALLQELSTRLTPAPRATVSANPL